jgi:hypothetical protein
MDVAHYTSQQIPAQARLWSKNPKKLPPRWRIAEQNRHFAGKPFSSPFRKPYGARSSVQRNRLE